MKNSEQEAIYDFLDHETPKIDALIDKIRTGTEKLIEYHTSLISAAVTGKIDVRNAGTGSKPTLTEADHG